MTVEDWQKRVVDERAELCARLAKLRQFKTTAEYAAMDRPQRALLDRQADIMQAYADILGQRIALFTS